MNIDIRKEIINVIKKDVPDCVLFSGGIDSSVILYESNNYSKVTGITVSIKENDCEDVKYSSYVANKLNIPLEIIYTDAQEVYSKIDTAIRILNSFSPEWISSTITLIIGIEACKKLGFKCVASGEGADDIFASFPFFQNYNGSNDELNFIVRERINEISVMTNEIARYFDIKSVTPFTDENLVNVFNQIPIDERIYKTNNIKTKYPLRMAYKNILPDEVIVRPQTMAFSGSGVYDILKRLENSISDEEFYSAKEEYFDFKNKLEYFLFLKYKDIFHFEQVSENSCIHCKSLIKKNNINCKCCQTLQYKGKELKFNA